MKRMIAEALWRLAVLGLLGWVGWELHGLRADLAAPLPEAETTVAAPGDEMLAAIDELRDEVAGLAQKVDAILVVMARTR